jgi:hypothetical protein
MLSADLQPSQAPSVPVVRPWDPMQQCSEAIPFFARGESVMMHLVPAVSSYPTGALTILGDSVDTSSPS